MVLAGIPRQTKKVFGRISTTTASQKLSIAPNKSSRRDLAFEHCLQMFGEGRPGGWGVVRRENSTPENLKWFGASKWNWAVEL